MVLIDISVTLVFVCIMSVYTGYESTLFYILTVRVYTGDKSTQFYIVMVALRKHLGR